MRINKYVLCSLATVLGTTVVQAKGMSPISPREYYAKLGTDVDEAALMDFFKIYQQEYNNCVDPDVFYNARLALAAKGYMENYEEDILKIQKCENMDEPLKQAIATRLADHRREQNTIVTASSMVAGNDAVLPTAEVSVVQTNEELKVAEVKPVAQKKKTLKKKKSKKVQADPVVEPIKSCRCAVPTVHVAEKAKPKDVAFKLQEKFRFRDGDKGTSELFSYKTSMSAETKDYEVGVVQEHLTAGRVPNGEYFGAFYNYSAGGKVKQNDSFKQNVFVPYFRYKGDKLNLTLATTPLDAQISALPTFDADVKLNSGFSVNVYSRSVEDSVLSKVGMRDIYSDQEWGRVVETGGKIKYNLDFGKNYFFNTDLSYNAYSGKNVHQNHSIKYHATVGKSKDGLSYGVYTAIEHYAENQDNYTFGHGGYYSPQLLLGAYPFISYRKETNTQKFAVDASVGAFYEEKDRVQAYFGQGQQEGFYEEENNWDLAYSFGAEFEQKFTDDISGYANGRYMSATSDYKELILTVGLKKEF